MCEAFVIDRVLMGFFFCVYFVNKEDYELKIKNIFIKEVGGFKKIVFKYLLSDIKKNL